MKTFWFALALLLSARAADPVEKPKTTWREPAWKQLAECQQKLEASTAAAEVHASAGEYAAMRADELERLADSLRNAASNSTGGTQVDVQIEQGKMVTKLPSGVLFESGKAELKPEGKELLRSIVPVLQGVGQRNILLAGHTDDTPVLGTATAFHSNLELSALRAISAFNFLQASGVDPKKMAVAGYGEFEPDADNGTAEGRAKNRRLEIILLPPAEETPIATSSVGRAP